MPTPHDPLCVTCTAQQFWCEHPEYSLVKLANGCFFIGEVNDQNEPHGQGVEFYPDGSVRTKLWVDPVDAATSGRWINGALSGKATQLLPNGDRSGGYGRSTLFGGFDVFNCNGNGNLHLEGEFDACTLSGLGACWDGDGKLVKCGRWAQSQLLESCAVPLRCLPEKRHLSAAGQSC